MITDNITYKQKTKAQKEFLEWAIKKKDLKLIESLSSMAPLTYFVESKEFKISSNASKLKKYRKELQNIIFEIIEIHNNDFSNLIPDDYMWNTHYTQSLSLIREKIKLTIFNVAKEISYQCNRQGNAWVCYMQRFLPLINELCSFEQKYQSCVYLFRPFNKDLITAVILDLNKQSPINSQPEDIKEVFREFFKRYEIPLIINFNYPFTQWLKNKKALIPDEKKLEMVNDLMEMRSLFFKNWDAEKHRVSINDDFDGIIDVRCATPCISIVKKELKVTDRETLDTVSWCFYTGKAFYNSNFFMSFGFNADYLLELLHDYLIILFSRTSAKERRECIDSEESNQVFYEHFQFNYDEESENNVESCLPPSENKIINIKFPKIRQAQLFLWLEQYLGCKILSGKGSEVKIYKPNARIYTLGKHKKDPQVSTWLIKEILKRVGIDEYVWIPLVKYL